MKKCVVSIILITIHSSIVNAANFESEIYRYAMLGSDSVQTFWIINTKTNRHTYVFSNSFDTISAPMQICDQNSGFICFFEESSGFGFGVPREISDNNEWKIEEIEYNIIRREKSIHCGTDYFIESFSKNGDREFIFIYNYWAGLRSIIEVSHEQHSNKMTFPTILTAIGFGFGAKKECIE